LIPSSIKPTCVYESDSVHQSFVFRLKTLTFCIAALFQPIIFKQVFLDFPFQSLRTHAEGILLPLLQFWHLKSCRGQRRSFMHFVMEKVKVS